MNTRPIGQKGFTIVELLIVIVVIAILATISIVAYRGVQARARDSQRKSDIATIAKALELYYIDNGKYPVGSCTVNCKINGAWSSTSDGSWSNLAAYLVPKYISSLPQDPQASTATNSAVGGGFNYDYAAIGQGSWCGETTAYQVYMLAYRLENEAQKYEVNGNCPSGATQPSNYASSEYVIAK
jgi:general secretion pathway protein G